MSEQTQHADAEVENRRKPVQEEIAGSGLAVDLFAAGGLPGCKLAFADGTMQGQVDRLASHAIQTALRQDTAKKIGRVQGNRHLGRVVENAQARSSVVQRQGGGSPSLDDANAILPFMDEMTNFISVVKGQCSEWRTFRGTMTGDVPGESLFQEAVNFHQRLQNICSEQPEPDEEHPNPVRNPYDSRITRALRNMLGGDSAMLAQMVSFGTNSQGIHTSQANGWVELSQFFGVNKTLMRHPYTIRIDMNLSGSGKTGDLGVKLGLSFRRAVVEYKNEFGMGYTKDLNMGSLVLSGGGGVSKTKSPMPEGTGISYSGSSSSKTPATSLNFWRPEDLETEYFAVSAGASLGTKSPDESMITGGSLKVFDSILFLGGARGNLLFDNLVGQFVKVSAAGTQSTDFGAGANVNVSVEGGYAIGGELKVTTQDLPDAPQATKEPAPKEPTEWSPLIVSSVSFDTGSSALDGFATKALDDAAQVVNDFLRQNPQAQLRIETVGHASPRWKSPRYGEIPYNLNMDLSWERAVNTWSYLRGQLQLTGGPIANNQNGLAGPVTELNDSAAGEMVRGKGSLEALEEGEPPNTDTRQYRRADVTVNKRIPPSEGEEG